MINYKIKKKEIIEEVLNGMYCDCCGKKVETPHGYNDTDINEFTIVFEYGSKFDLEKWKMDVCDECIEKWVSSFKHSISKNKGII